MGRRRAALVAAVVIAALAVTSTLGGGPAGAQSIDELRARAQGIAAQLERLNEEGDRLEQRYLETGERMKDVERQIAETRDEVAGSERRMNTAKGEAASYLVNAYMGADTASRFTLGAQDPNAAVNEKVLLETLQGGRQQIADDLRASKLQLEEKREELQSAQEELNAYKAEQERIRSELDAAVSQQRRLLAGANAELQQAIAAEQARRQAEAEARARAALEAAARQATAQQAAREAAAQQTALQSPARQAPQAGSGQVAARAATGRAAAPAAIRPNRSVAYNYAGSNSAIQFALSKVGTPYLWGGTGNGGYDCSGLSQAAFASAGKSLPRTAAQQYAATQRVSDPQPGDLVFYGGSNASHMAIYLGNGMMVAAPRTGDVVKVQPVYGSPTYGRVG